MAYVGIPFYNRVDLTAPLVDRLLADDAVERLILWDNGSDDPDTAAWLAEAARVRRVTVMSCPRVGQVVDGQPWSLYASWNGTWRRALSDACPDVVILNNDLTVPAGFVDALTRALRDAPADVWAVYPSTDRDVGVGSDTRLRRTRGLWPGGFAPFAFALKAEAYGKGLPMIDERFTFYCGDVELLWQIQGRGRWAARADHIGIDHALGATRKAVRGRMGRTIAADRRLRKSKYPAGPNTAGAFR